MSNTRVPERSEIAEKWQWDTASIFSTVDEWEHAFANAKKGIQQLQSYQDQLISSPETLYSGLQTRDELFQKIELVYVYAHLKADEDTSDSFYQGLFDRAQSLISQAMAATAFFEPEILSASEKTIEQYITEHTPLELYSHELSLLNERRGHVLSDREEALLAKVSEVTSQSSQAFSMLSNADLTFDSIKDEDGEETEVSNGRFVQLLKNQHRRVRKDAFHSLFRSYTAHENTFASLLNGQVKRNIFYANARNYASPRAAAMHANHIPEKVYDQLITVVNKNLHLFQRYLRLRKKLLHLDELHFYDLYVPLIDTQDYDADYEQAKDWIIEGLKPLGEDYIHALTSGLNDGWVDVHENKGKRSGAYSSGAYHSKPFILMNWQDSINEMFTLAHELGHSMHSYYTRKSQPYPYGDYTIFVAEVASTLNEKLVAAHLEKKTENKRNRLFLLNQQLEDFRATVFRQTMFAEFEQAIHQAAQRGEPLTPDSLKQMYLELNQRYFGDEVVYDEDIAMEWARIPHFYMNFYVYQYATGFSAASALSKQILEEGKPAVDRYLTFLKAGSSDYPIEVLKKAGVDMTQSEPLQAAMSTFEQTLIQAEKVADELLAGQ